MLLSLETDRGGSGRQTRDPGGPDVGEQGGNSARLLPRLRGGRRSSTRATDQLRPTCMLGARRARDPTPRCDLRLRDPLGPL